MRIALNEEIIVLPQRIQLRRAVRSEEAITDNAGEIEDNGPSTQRAQRDRSTVFNPIFRRPTEELGIRKRKIGCLATNCGTLAGPRGLINSCRHLAVMGMNGRDIRPPLGFVVLFL